jgi:hypothetical protein
MVRGLDYGVDAAGAVVWQPALRRDDCGYVGQQAKQPDHDGDQERAARHGDYRGGWPVAPITDADRPPDPSHDPDDDQGSADGDRRFERSGLAASEVRADENRRHEEAEAEQDKVARYRDGRR